MHKNGNTPLRRRDRHAKVQAQDAPGRRLGPPHARAGRLRPRGGVVRVSLGRASQRPDGRNRAGRAAVAVREAVRQKEHAEAGKADAPHHRRRTGAVPAVAHAAPARGVSGRAVDMPARAGVHAADAGLGRGGNAGGKARARAADRPARERAGDGAAGGGGGAGDARAQGRVPHPVPDRARLARGAVLRRAVRAPSASSTARP